MKEYTKVFFVGPLVEGTSDNGNHWERQTVVFETIGCEQKKLAVEFMGERKTAYTKDLEYGQEVCVEFVIDCREYMGKWYTRLEGRSVKSLRATSGEPEDRAAQETMPPESRDGEEAPY